MYNIDKFVYALQVFVISYWCFYTSTCFTVHHWIIRYDVQMYPVTPAKQNVFLFLGNF